MIDLTRPIAELVEQVQLGKVSARELVQASFDKIEASKDLHAVLEINPEALNQADKIDRQIAEAGQKILKGSSASLTLQDDSWGQMSKVKGQRSNVNGQRLLGIPFIVKDNFLTLNTHTTAASNILKPFKSPYQATATNKLEAEGAILVAKANLDAFGHGSSTENSDFGVTLNPWDKTRVPGGSSGGSAAAVAAGLACFALGTDTGSSIRLPASFCGIVGLKPTYGLVSRSGVIAMGSSFDVIGPLANSVADASLILDIMAGKDELDATTIERDLDSYQVKTSSSPNSLQNARSAVQGLKVGVIKEFMGEGVDAGVKAQINAAISRLEVAGAEITEISIPYNDLALACYYILVPAEISSNLSRFDGIRYGHSAVEAKTLAETYDLSRDQGFGPEAKRRILIGTYVLSSGYYDAYYKKAQKVRTMIKKQYERALEEVDVLVGPNAPSTAFKIGQKAHNPLDMYLTDVMLVGVNLAGIPSISVPVGLSDGLPVGIQVMASQCSEAKLLRIAAEIESEAPKMELPV